MLSTNTAYLPDLNEIVNLFAGAEALAISHTSKKDEFEFYNQVFDVINNHKLPYMYLRHLRDGRDFVCFTSNLKTVLNKNDFECVSVKSLSEQLEWEYVPTRIDGKVKNVMRIEFKEFLHFLYGVGDE